MGNLSEIHHKMCVILFEFHVFFESEIYSLVPYDTAYEPLFE
jgi:hypothetical protein